MPEESPTRKKRFGCSPGCLISLVVVAIGLAIAGYFGMRPINEAKQLEQDLLDRHAVVSAYVPAPDGAVAADRMEIFVEVRTALLAQTGHIQETFAKIDSVEQQEELSAKEGLGMLRNVFGALPKMVEFFSVRNGALLERGMGLGEYFYIYVLAYGERLCQADAAGRPASECEFVTGRTTRELTQMLRNQLANHAHLPDEEMAADLKAEIAALEGGDRVLPWLLDRPESITASLEPYADELDGLFCLATRELELGQKNKNLGGIGD
jgi:hypothetical protein